jgi:hypothetical protein
LPCPAMKRPLSLMLLANMSVQPLAGSMRLLRLIARPSLPHMTARHFSESPLSIAWPTMIPPSLMSRA